MMHEPQRKKAHDAYRDFGARDLWNELTAADQQIMEYLYARNAHSESKAASKPDPNAIRVFWDAWNDSLTLIQLLKKRPKSERYEIREYLNSKLYAVNDAEKKNIQSHIGFIDKELL